MKHSYKPPSNKLILCGPLKYVAQDSEEKAMKKPFLLNLVLNKILDTLLNTQNLP